MKLGLIADMHGDYIGFAAALRILDAEGAEHILCAGDVADRGPEAGEIIRILQERDIPCIRGNHDVTVVANQEHWRSAGINERLSKLGRVVDDDTIAYLSALPETLTLTFDGIPVLLAHGTPWSDVMGVFRDTRQGVLNRIVENYGDSADVIILGHTHEPLRMRVQNLWILNPGSIYGITIRDSHTCALLDLPSMDYTVFDVRTGER